MRLSWNSLKVSIAGAMLSHLVQKDKIWDHGSMAEQARIIFFMVQKARTNGNIELLRKQCTAAGFEHLIIEQENQKKILMKEPSIKEIAVVEVHPGKNNKPDMFAALISGCTKDVMGSNTKEFAAQCSFVRQGEWWLLDEMRVKAFFKN